LRLLFIGERREGSAPTWTLARNLALLNCEYVFASDLPPPSIRGWISLLHSVDAVLVQAYGSTNNSLVRQCAVALTLGKVVVRHWAGSDVLTCIEEPGAREEALLLDRLRPLNLTPAQWLREELETIGIRARVYPQIIDAPPKAVPPVTGPLPLSVLVYLPHIRREFYGERFVRQAVEQNPDIKFFIVADEDHALAAYPNVDSLGWVADMDDLWPHIGCLLRMTEHDGWPRMILEGLIRGKYAICNLSLEGCWQATNHDQVQDALDRFRSERAQPNSAGTLAAQKLRQELGAEKILEWILEDQATMSLSRRLSGLLMAATLTIRRRVRP